MTRQMERTIKEIALGNACASGNYRDRYNPIMLCDLPVISTIPEVLLVAFLSSPLVNVQSRPITSLTSQANYFKQGI